MTTHCIFFSRFTPGLALDRGALRIWLSLALVFSLVFGELAAATPSSGLVESPAKSSSTDKGSLPGAQIAQTLSLVTGIAISPLLGVSAVGAWKYFGAKSEERPGLPWFSNPLFWIPALGLVALCFLKDTLGPAVPTALKKPFDLAEVFENKVSALVATGAFIPVVTSLFKAWVPSDASLDTSGFAFVQFASIWGYVMLPFAFAAFCVVWLVSHTIQILILVSPFATVDAALKAFRAFLLSTVTVTSFANSYVGAIWSLVLIGICYFLAGWAFRTTVFGTVVAWELVTGRKHRFEPSATENAMFLARPLEDAPIRTYGYLSRDSDGVFTFRYRPWMILAERSIALPKARYAIGRGLLHSEVIELQGDDNQSLFFLPPRYRDHEEALAKIYALGPVEDIGLVKGFNAIWSWLKSLFGAGTQAA